VLLQDNPLGDGFAGLQARQRAAEEAAECVRQEAVDKEQQRLAAAEQQATAERKRLAERAANQLFKVKPHSLLACPRGQTIHHASTALPLHCAFHTHRAPSMSSSVAGSMRRLMPYEALELSTR